MICVLLKSLGCLVDFCIVVVAKDFDFVFVVIAYKGFKEISNGVFVEVW